MATFKTTTPSPARSGEEYETLRLICPNAAPLAGKLADISRRPARRIAICGFEIGCGTGDQHLLPAFRRAGSPLLAIDASAKMLEQARANLRPNGRRRARRFVEADALEALRALPDESLDLVASNYATHNFRADYRRQRLRRDVSRR